jgi:hypothetical protein
MLAARDRQSSPATFANMTTAPSRTREHRLSSRSWALCDEMTFEMSMLEKVRVVGSNSPMSLAE